MPEHRIIAQLHTDQGGSCDMKLVKEDCEILQITTLSLMALLSTAVVPPSTCSQNMQQPTLKMPPRTGGNVINQVSCTLKYWLYTIVSFSWPKNESSNRSHDICRALRHAIHIGHR